MAQEHLKFSAIVASRHRPDWLKKCLMALRQQDYPAFEIVVVADPESVAALDGEQLKSISFDRPNLSAARNIGISAAGGDVCAFLDDDAVAEPTWLSHLNDALQYTKAEAVTGFVRGRNGISFQSKAHCVDKEAETHRLESAEDTCSIPVVAAGQALKLVGTNMAIRRECLKSIGGFDESFRFFLEDADMSITLAKASKRLALQPWAQVHHSFAPSARRTVERAPVDLEEIGRSTAIYLRKHMGAAAEEFWKRTEHRERARLIRHMVLGSCQPRDVAERLDSLRAGWEEGLSIDLKSAARTFEQTEFKPFSPRRAKHRVLAKPLLLNRSQLMSKAEKIASSGGQVSIFSFSLTPFRHRVRYLAPGYWMHSGGLFGQSVRAGPWFRWYKFTRRVNSEIRRVAKIRGISDTTHR